MDTVTISAPPGATRLEIQPSAAGPKKLVACLIALGCDTSAWILGGGQLSVLGVRPDLRLAIDARYDIGETATGRTSATFCGARVRDPVGVVRNLEFDYSINKPNAKRLILTDADARKLGDRRSREYNDGAQVRFITCDLETASEMNEWLDDWLDLLKVDHKRQSAARKKKSTDLDLMLGATWRG